MTEEITAREAGRRGGLATLKKHGVAHLARAGRKGKATQIAKRAEIKAQQAREKDAAG